MTKAAQWIQENMGKKSQEYTETTKLTQRAFHQTPKWNQGNYEKKTKKLMK
jgi:hypothetical protein